MYSQQGLHDPSSDTAGIPLCTAPDSLQSSRERERERERERDYELCPSNNLKRLTNYHPGLTECQTMSIPLSCALYVCLVILYLGQLMTVTHVCQITLASGAYVAS